MSPYVTQIDARVEVIGLLGYLAPEYAGLLRFSPFLDLSRSHNPRAGEA